MYLIARKFLRLLSGNCPDKLGRVQPLQGHFVLSPVPLASKYQDGGRFVVLNDRQLRSHGKIGDCKQSLRLTKCLRPVYINSLLVNVVLAGLTIVIASTPLLFSNQWKSQVDLKPQSLPTTRNTKILKRTIRPELERKHPKLGKDSQSQNSKSKCSELVN